MREVIKETEGLIMERLPLICGHCHKAARGHASVHRITTDLEGSRSLTRIPLCHPLGVFEDPNDLPPPDCYHLVTVYRHPIPCPDCPGLVGMLELE